MRIRTIVEAEVEADISIEDMISAMGELPIDERKPFVMQAINTAMGVLSRIQIDSISQFNDAQKKIVHEALLSCAKKFESQELRSESRIAEHDNSNEMEVK